MHRRFAITVLFILLVVCAPARAGRRVVLVLQEEKRPVVEELLSSYRDSCECDIERRFIKNMDEKSVLEIVAGIRPDLVLPIGTGALMKVRGVVDTPVLHLMSLHPERLLPIGKNFTGVSMYVPAEKNLTVLTSALPHVGEVGFIFTRETWPIAEKCRAAAARMGVALLARKVKDGAGALDALEEMRNYIDAFWIIPDRIYTPERVKEMIAYTAAAGIPVVSFAKKHIDAGAFIVISLNVKGLGKQAGKLTANPRQGRMASTPLMDPEHVDVEISEKIAEKLKIEFNTEPGWRVEK